MKYVYGPVKSRRIGYSLGLSLACHKVCDFDCVYCQLGKTTEPITQRKEYVRTEEIINELKSWLQNNPQLEKTLDYITISGSGEPTLNIGIGQVISQIKKITACRIAVITNASLLNDAQVRLSISEADLILPSLDSVVPQAFSKIDRPHPDIKLDQIINGLISLRKEFRGQIWLEVMLVKGINDDLRYIKKLKEVIDRINPHKIQLNSPVRTTAEPNVFPVEKNKLDKIKEILGEKCEII